MKTIRKLIYRDLIASVTFVCLGFLALFSFFDLVEELPALNGSAPQIIRTLLFVLLQIPGHIYELLPIATLIGAVLVMARFAQNSEFTVLRTSGLGPTLALKTLLALGCVFVLVTFVIGDYVAPIANRTGQLLKAQQYSGTVTSGRIGAWLKERQRYSHFAVNVGALNGDGNMSLVRIYEFDHQNRIVSTTESPLATFQDDAWLLVDAKRIDISTQNPPSATVQTLPQYRWPTEINAQMVSVALLKPERMSAYHLFRYIQHLDDNGQSAQLYEIEFWKKLFYPLSCLVMLMLALPFAYLHFRQSGIAGYVFGGVVIGISFFLLNNVFGYIGNISQWPPMLAAAAPSVIYLGLSLGAFSWVVFKR